MVGPVGGQAEAVGRVGEGLISEAYKGVPLIILKASKNGRHFGTEKNSNLQLDHVTLR